MRKFYETYQGDEIVAPLLRQLPWTHNLIILNQSKRPEELEFYLRLAIREQWSKRELERQIKTVKAGRFEPEYLGKLGFYLEALDRDVKKPHEHAASLFVNTCVTYDRLISL